MMTESWLGQIVDFWQICIYQVHPLVLILFFLFFILYLGVAFYVADLAEAKEGYELSHFVLSLLMPMVYWIVAEARWRNRPDRRQINIAIQDDSAILRFAANSEDINNKFDGVKNSLDGRRRSAADTIAYENAVKEQIWQENQKLLNQKLHSLEDGKSAEKSKKNYESNGVQAYSKTQVSLTLDPPERPLPFEQIKVAVEQKNMDKALDSSHNEAAEELFDATDMALYLNELGVVEYDRGFFEMLPTGANGYRKGNFILITRDNEIKKIGAIGTLEKDFAVMIEQKTLKIIRIKYKDIALFRAEMTREEKLCLRK